MYPVNIIENLNALDTRMVIPFLPSDIIDLQLWLDANDPATLFQDAAKTISAGDGDVVGAWADKSGNGNDVVQTTTSKKPSYQLDVQNGLPVVRFAGTDDVLTGGDILDLHNSSSTLYVVGKSTLNSGGYVGKAALLNAPGRYSMVYAGGNLRGDYGNDIGAQNVVVARTHGSFEIVGQILKRDGDANRLRANGTEMGSTAFADDTASDWDNVWEFIVGGFGPDGSNLPLTGDMAEIVKINRALNISETTLLESYFSAKWGIALS